MIPTFDELYVISDLHLGGTTGFQIFDQGRLLGEFISWLAVQSPERSIALVLNGDVVDFLAEKPGLYLDPAGAIDKLKRIVVDDAAFSPVAKALATFVHSDRRTLVIVVGNHDVEMALPPVHEWLAQRLSDGDATARGRIRFAVDGAGFPCSIGGKRVLCVHGNEVDTWNVVDHRQLLEVARALNRGTPVPEWTPNAGTKMVIDVMNGVKEKMPFVDLLKPEVEAVPAMILAMDPSQASRIGGLVAVAGRLAKDAARISTGFLSAEAVSDRPAQTPEAALDTYLRKQLGAPAAARVDVDALLDRAEDTVRGGTNSVVLAGRARENTLGIGGLVVDTILGRPPEENLRDTLSKWLAKDTTFDPTTTDSTFKLLDEAIGPGVDVVIAGHTHLHRALRRTRGTGAYFNSGTWIRLIQLGQDVLESKEKFAPVFATLKGTMQQIDDAQLVMRRPTVVRVAQGVGGVAGELLLAQSSGGVVRLDPVANTRLGV
jgi:UDP-2,3-diacylglucosamine pyrophosphatase LpxH